MAVHANSTPLREIERAGDETMTVAQLEGSSVARDLEALEIYERWMALEPDERASFIQQVRDEIPGAVEIADALERHHRSLQARA